MSGKLERRWDDAVETAWREFRQRLADRLADIAEDGSLVVEVADEAVDGTTPYCQVFFVGPGILRVEAVSNVYLAPGCLMDWFQEGMLAHLGFGRPQTDDWQQGETNFWVDLDQREADKAAVMVVRALREVYSVRHPVYLAADGLEPRWVAAEPETTDPQLDQPMSPTSVEEVRAAVDVAVAELYDDAPQWDDGDLPLPTEQCLVWVVVSRAAPRVHLSCLLLVQVKGGRVSVEPDEADRHVWWAQSGASRRRIRPVDQVRDGEHALKRYVEQHPHGGVSRRVAWAHGVVTPFTAFDEDFSVPELPRWALHDKDDLTRLEDRVPTNVRLMEHGQRSPAHDDVEVLTDVLAGRFGSPYDMVAESDERAAEFDRLTMEQASILRVTRLLHRVEVRGGAGSGKTVLAPQQAKELTKGGQGRKPQRVALLCYSIGLAEHLRRTVATWDRRSRPAYVRTFHAFGQQWGASEGDRTDSELWEERLPDEMAELAAALPDGKKYDALIVDEAQDLADSWWTPVLRSLKDEDEGGLFVYSDENQRIFARFGRPPVALVPLLDGGWEPRHVALLTTGHRHPVQVERTGFHDQEGYWRTYWDGDVFYGHVLGCKGLERRAVVLCLNEDGSRAADELVVGEPETVRRVGGPDVAKRVGIG